jgi:hypothetical protein
MPMNIGNLQLTQFKQSNVMLLRRAHLALILYVILPKEPAEQVTVCENDS